MKKYLIGGTLMIAFIAYLLFANKNSVPITPDPVATSPTTNPAASPVAGGPTAAASTSPTPAQTSAPTPSAPAGQYKDGIYTGSVADAFYGNLQAVAVIQGGMLANVTFPQSPTNGHSAQITRQALPILKQEAIAAQSANVNVVSGATQDSQAFRQSLASALAQAKN